MKNVKEWRVVSNTKFGTFQCFDSEMQARRFIEGYVTDQGVFIAPGSFRNGGSDGQRLESRSVGSGPKDWRTEPHSLVIAPPLESAGKK